MSVAARRSALPQKVVLVCEATLGGAGKHVLDLAEHLPHHGYDVLLAYADRRSEHGFLERVSRHRDFGYQATALDVERAPGPRDIPAALALRRTIADFGGADLLHGHSSKGGALARLIRWTLARRVVYSPHAFYTMSQHLRAPQRMLYGVIEYALATVTDRVITLSRHEYEHARALGIAAKKLVLIENGIQLRERKEVARVRAQTRAALGIGDTEVVIGFVGRLSKQKAPEVALQAIRKIRDVQPSIRFVLVGDGPDAELVRRTIQELQLGESVTWIPSAFGRDIIPAFDVFLMSSWYEGFPYVLLEALESGCAIITTDVGGAEDTVLHGTNGFIVSPGAPDALAARALEVCGDVQTLYRMRHASRQHAAQFSIERMLARTTGVYRSLLEEEPESVSDTVPIAHRELDVRRAG